MKPQDTVDLSELPYECVPLERTAKKHSDYATHHPQIQPNNEPGVIRRQWREHGNFDFSTHWISGLLTLEGISSLEETLYPCDPRFRLKEELCPLLVSSCFLLKKKKNSRRLPINLSPSLTTKSTTAGVSLSRLHRVCVCSYPSVLSSFSSYA